MNAKRANGGFTLIEILVAATIFSLIVGAMYSTFYGALRLREKAYETFEKDPPKYFMLQRLETDLSHCVYPGGVFAGAIYCQKDENMKADSDRFEFYTASGTVDENHKWGDIQKVVYSLKEPLLLNTKGNDLIREVTRNLLAPSEEDPVEERLFHSVNTLKFYFYDGQDWLDYWDSTSQDNPMPQAISVEITFVEPLRGETPIMPINLVVPIVTTASSVSSQSTDSTSQEENNNDNNNEQNQNNSGPGNNPNQSKSPGTSQTR